MRSMSRTSDLRLPTSDFTHSIYRIDDCFHRDSRGLRSEVHGLTSVLVRSVVRKLQINPEIVPLQQRNRFLQRVAIFAADAYQVALNRGLRLLLRVLYQLHDLARFLDRNALLHGDAALGRSARGGLNRAVGPSLQR